MAHCSTAWPGGANDKTEPNTRSRPTHRCVNGSQIGSARWELTTRTCSPINAWRHTFKQIANRFGISERMSDYITGHAHKSVGAAYGAPTLEDMAEALKKFPRYVVE